MKIIVNALIAPTIILSYLFIPFAMMKAILIASWELAVDRINDRWDEEKEDDIKNEVLK